MCIFVGVCVCGGAGDAREEGESGVGLHAGLCLPPHTSSTPLSSPTPSLSHLPGAGPFEIIGRDVDRHLALLFE